MKTRSPNLPPNPRQPSRDSGGWALILILLFHGATGLVGMVVLGKTVPVSKSEKAAYIVPGSNRSGASMKMITVNEMRKKVIKVPAEFFRSRLNCPPSQPVPTPPEIDPIDSMEPLTGFMLEIPPELKEWKAALQGRGVGQNFESTERCLQ